MFLFEFEIIKKLPEFEKISAGMLIAGIPTKAPPKVRDGKLANSIAT